MFDKRSTLLRNIRGFLAESGMSRTEFGYVCLGDPGFITKLERGRNPRENTRQRITKFINKSRLKGGK